MIYLLENTIKHWVVKAYLSEDKAREFAKWLNSRWNYGSVYTVWIVRKVKLSQYKEVMNLLNEKDDRIQELESMLHELKQYDIGEVLPYHTVDRLNNVRVTSSDNFYCKSFTEDGMLSDDEKCVSQCQKCKAIEAPPVNQTIEYVKQYGIWPLK